MNDEITVVVMPETDGNTLCVTLRGTIRHVDHYNYLRGGIERILERHDDYNLLICYSPAYQGWNKDAADISMKTIIDYGKKLRKLANVNPPEKKIWMQKMAPDLFGGETKNFPLDDLNLALAWVKS